MDTEQIGGIYGLGFEAEVKTLLTYVFLKDSSNDLTTLTTLNIPKIVSLLNTVCEILYKVNGGTSFYDSTKMKPKLTGNLSYTTHKQTIDSSVRNANDQINTLVQGLKDETRRVLLLESIQNGNGIYNVFDKLEHILNIIHQQPEVGSAQEAKSVTEEEKAGEEEEKAVEEGGAKETGGENIRVLQIEDTQIPEGVEMIDLLNLPFSKGSVQEVPTTTALTIRRPTPTPGVKKKVYGRKTRKSRHK